MKQYLSALIQKIGRLNVSIYLLLLSVGYGLYSILPYTLPKIFSGSGGLHVNPFFMVLSILSFLVVPILNYPNNLAMQSVRKYSKQVLFDDLVKKKYMYFDDMETGKIQDLFSESSFCTRSLLYSCVQFIIKHSAIIIINSTAFFNFHFLLGVTYILSYSVYFFISIVLLKKQNNRIHSTLLSASDVNSYLIDYCQNLDSIYSFRSYDKEKEKLEDIKSGGCTVILTDHHILQKENDLPDVDMIIDPNVSFINNPLIGRNWCGAAVIYKLFENLVTPEIRNYLLNFAGIYRWFFRIVLMP